MSLQDWVLQSLTISSDLCGSANNEGGGVIRLIWRPSAVTLHSWVQVMSISGDQLKLR